MRLLVLVIFSIILGIDGRADAASRSLNDIFNGTNKADYKVWSKATGVPLEDLKKYCKKLDCEFDKLKDAIQVTANDSSAFISFSGRESRTIEFTWISDVADKVLVSVFDVDESSNGFDNISGAEIYVGKEKIVDINSNIDHRINPLQGAGLEKIVTVSGNITLDQARQLAEANQSTVTIRFFGNNGHIDRELPRKHKLMTLIDFANSFINRSWETTSN